ncbi:hypothetical protein PHYPO_G00003420 [Pangasianodon hypophthalmus]|uniref:Adenylate cyclase N-terminal domain-containing protein n=1 Tax=Pangasianodon hypophthalmus TaxID=310915 RepID=A0A5N5Q658_PANHP|nr:hypothetical protein PHYPO_G00003420 [Pangasianodon hypophthalmus]
MLRARVESFLPVSEARANAATRPPALSLKELGEEQEKDKKVKQAPDEQRQGTRSMWTGAMRGRRYLLERGTRDGVNSDKEGARRQRSPDWLYESYCRMSQQHPLIVFLLLIVMGACLALLAVFFGSGLDIEAHVAFVITVPTALAIFLSIFVLVCIESVFKKLLRLFALVVWACLVAMGYLFMFFGGIICPWDQVRIEVVVFIHAVPVARNPSEKK